MNLLFKMKQFYFKWLFFCAMGAVISAAIFQFHGVDPSDDFRFSLGDALRPEHVRYVSKDHLTKILAQRLDLLPRDLAARLGNHLIYLSKVFRLDLAFVLSLIEVESNFHMHARSSVGAVGLMQLMVSTANFTLQKLPVYWSGYENFNPLLIRKKVLSEKEIMDPFVNISLGIAYLAWLRDHYQGMNPYYVLAAYNLGPGRLDELLSQGRWKPSGTKRYFLAIRRGVPSFQSIASKRI